MLMGFMPKILAYIQKQSLSPLSNILIRAYILQREESAHAEVRRGMRTKLQAAELPTSQAIDTVRVLGWHPPAARRQAFICIRPSHAGNISGHISFSHTLCVVEIWREAFLCRMGLQSLRSAQNMPQAVPRAAAVDNLTSETTTSVKHCFFLAFYTSALNQKSIIFFLHFISIHDTK